MPAIPRRRSCLPICMPRGDGVPADFARAKSLIEGAVARGAGASGWTALGDLYRTADASHRDMAQAVDAYQHAVDLGDTASMIRLAGIVGAGDGVPVDFERARSLLVKAIAVGDDNAVRAWIEPRRPLPHGRRCPSRHGECGRCLSACRRSRRYDVDDPACRDPRIGRRRAGRFRAGEGSAGQGDRGRRQQRRLGLGEPWRPLPHAPTPPIATWRRRPTPISMPSISAIRLR